MLFPASRKKSFSIMVGGGDHGMDVGIGLSIMIQAGVSIEEFHPGTAEYLMIGERITETMFGEVIHGTITRYTIVIFKGTGGPGMRPAIGIDRSIENLHTPMMENRIAVDKETLTRVPQALKCTVQAGPLKAELQQVNTVQEKLIRANIQRRI